MTSDDTAPALSHFRDVIGDIGDSYIPDSVERAEMIGDVMVAAGELLGCSLAEAERAAGRRVYRRTLTGPNPDCPHADLHAPSPAGYLAWHEWAEEMAKTHDQSQCPGCDRWLIFAPKAKEASDG